MQAPPESRGAAERSSCFFLRHPGWWRTTTKAPTARWRDPVVALVLSTTFLTAPASVTAQTLTLDDCIRIALERNPRIAATANLERAATARQRVARAGRLPLVNLHGTARYDPLDGYDPDLTDGGEYAGQLQVEQSLYDGGGRRLVARQADVGLEKAATERALARAELQLDVRLAYIDLVGARRQRALIDQSIADLETYLTTVRSLARGGAVPTTDVATVEIQLQTESILRSDLDTDADTALQQLVEHLGLPADTLIAVRDSIELPAHPDHFEPELNPDLRAAAFGIESSEIESRITSAGRLPTVAFFGSVGAWTSRRQLVEGGTRRILGYEAGVTLDLPIWNWGSITAAADAQRAETDGLRRDSDTLRRHLESEFAATQHRLAVTTEKSRLLESTLDQALAHYEDLRVRYSGGGSSSLEVLEAHRQLLEIAQQRASTRSQIEALQSSLLRSAEETP